MNTTSHSSQYLWFERGGQRFAASMGHLQEVLPAPALRALPAVEPALSGLMVLRDCVLPVFDPISLASARKAPEASSPIVVVLGARGQPTLGLLAERVGKVVELSTLDPLPEPARFPAAFSGQAESPGTAGLLVLDAAALAAAMGLDEQGAPPAGPDSQTLNQRKSPVRK